MHSFKLIMVAECESTQAEADRLIAEDPRREPFAVRADRQTAGRGSRGRSWDSPDGNLFVSYALPQRPAWPEPQLAPYAVALGVADTLDRLPGAREAELTLKWPNDVLVGGAKVCGTLLTAHSVGTARWIIIGVGINVASHPDGTPYPATHLTAEGITPPALDILANDLGAALITRLQNWLRDGFAGTRTAYLARAHALGETVTLRPRGGDAPEVGIYRGLSEDGAFLLERDGRLVPHYAGDIFPGL